jgi:hypothetical protein
LPRGIFLIPDEIQKFFEFYDKFQQIQTQLESDIFEHYQEMCLQVDEQREKLKMKIDDIVFAMIDEIKKHEETYLKQLKEHFSSYDDSKSIENELTDIEEVFRNPNLLIQTIREMQQKQEESLKDIQLKLNEMDLVKDNLQAINDFKPNVSVSNPK